MSCDLARLKSASALRDWEESRAKNFSAWCKAARRLLDNLQASVQLGASQHAQLQLLLSQRSAADKAYAQALVRMPEQEGDVASESPLLSQVFGLQRSMAQLRETFAVSVLEGSLLSALASTRAEFEQTAGALFAKLEKGLQSAQEANQKVQEAMDNYRRSSIQDPSRPTGWLSQEHKEHPDGWLQEHRYRWAVATLRELQRSFTSELCNSVAELMRLVVWRDEMGRKVLCNFCAKLHQVETSVQSLANDGIKAMAGQCVEGPVKKELVKALNEDFSNPEVQVPAGADDKAWPALTSLSALSRLARRPPASALGRFSGALQSPRRWAAPQLRVVVLSKDRWLHCFHLEASRLQALSAGGGATAPAHGTGIEGLEALEAEPQWSMYAPSTAVLPLHGRPRCFEVEVTKRSFLGLRSSRKEILQADTEDSFLRWVEVLLEAGAENRGIAVPSRPPPPPPPPQPIQESQHEDLPVAEDLHLAEDPQCEDLGQKVPKVEDGQDVAQGILEKQPEDPSETATRISNVLTTEGVFE